MKVWISKYALTVGIFEREAEIENGMAIVRGNDEPGHVNQYFHGAGNDWHYSREAAASKANDMRAAKLKSLRKQIANIEALKFD